MKGRKIFEPPRFMTVQQCARQMLEVEQMRQEVVYGESSLAVGVARVGSKEQQIVSGTLSALSEVDMGKPLHSLVLVGRRVHDLEKEVLREFAIDRAVFDEVWERDYGK